MNAADALAAKTHEARKDLEMVLQEETEDATEEEEKEVKMEEISNEDLIGGRKLVPTH